MIGIEQYRKIQEYKALGLAQTKTAKALGITYSSVSKYWNMSEEDYVREAEKERYHMDNYRQYILEHLKICPQMRIQTSILNWWRPSLIYKLNELHSTAI